jgi:hypothetical protein
MSSEVIGQRLAQLRSELGTPDEKRWSRARVGEATGVPLNALTVLENKGAGTIETLTTLLVFYHGHGFNPTWVILSDNSTVSKWVAAENVKTVPAAMVAQKLADFKGRMLQVIDEARMELENG